MDSALRGKVSYIPSGVLTDLETYQVHNDNEESLRSAFMFNPLSNWFRIGICRTINSSYCTSVHGMVANNFQRIPKIHFSINWKFQSYLHNWIMKTFIGKCLWLYLLTKIRNSKISVRRALRNKIYIGLKGR